MTDTSPTLTEAEQTALARIRAGTHVMVEREELYDVLWHALDDMGPRGHCVCGEVKTGIVELYARCFPQEAAEEFPYEAMIKAAQEGK